MARKKHPFRLDTTLAGARQLLTAIQQHGSVRWDGHQWVEFAGEPEAPTLAALHYTLPHDAPPDDPLPNVLLVFWRTKGDGSVVTVPRDVPDADSLTRLAAYLSRVQAWLDSAQTGGGDRTPIPKSVAQLTFIEARFAGQALADGPTQRYWEELAGEVAMLHIIPDAPLQTKVRPPLSPEWLDASTTVEAIKDDLRSAGVPAIIALHTALDLTIKNARVTITLDDFMHAIGWRPRSTAERAEKRRALWRWILLFDSMYVIGRRPGTYKDPLTKKMLDLQSYDPLLRIVGRRYPITATGPDETQPPIDVSLVAGQWVERFRNNPQVLTYFGDVRRLGEIPAGKPSGAWAQAIGLALNQRWREGAAYATVHTVGEDNHPTMQRRRPFTRRELLVLFPPQPTVEEILESEHPRRAQEYWDDAITLLKQQGVVGHYKPLAELPPRRQGWQNAWLTQPLDIRPPTEAVQPLVNTARKARTTRRTRARPPQ